MWAVMDIGTNSTRLLIADYDQSTGQLQPLKRALKITRIGEGMSETNRVMSLVAIERTINALEVFAEIIADYPVKKIRLVATQAVREAANQAELVDKVKARLSWMLEVIPGEQEALLSYQGAVQGLKTEGFPLVVDIGGGSTEFLVSENEREIETAEEVKTVATLTDRKLLARSLPLGALRLLEHPQTDPGIQLFLTKQLAGFPFPGQTTALVAVGGTATTLAAVRLGLVSYEAEKVQGLTLPLAEIKEIYQRLQAMRAAERLQVAGISPGREDIIIPGLQILLAVMRFFGKTDLTVSDQDLLQGVILAEYFKH